MDPPLGNSDWDTDHRVVIRVLIFPTVDGGNLALLKVPQKPYALGMNLGARIPPPTIVHHYCSVGGSP